MLKRLRFDINFAILTLWMIWIDAMTFFLTKSNEFKVKYLTWNDLIMFAKVVLGRVVKYVKTSTFLAKALLEGFDQIWGARSVPCRRVNMEITWNWKRQCR